MIDKIRAFEEQVWEWLATTKSGTLVKVALAAAITAALQYLVDHEFSPYVMTIGTAVLTLLLNMLNPRDTRYGIGSGEPEGGLD